MLTKEVSRCGRQSESQRPSSSKLIWNWIENGVNTEVEYERRDVKPGAYFFESGDKRRT